jgi:hypothetical protein
MTKAVQVFGAITVLWVLCFAACQHWGLHDAAFESSDHIWADNTVKFHGRGFDSVIWTFEEYRYETKNEAVALVRVTPDSRWKFLWSKDEKADPMWKVPVGKSVELRPYLGRGLKQAEIDEITSRANAALEYWQKK